MQKCGLGNEVRTTLPDEKSFAIGYVLYQIDPQTYSSEEALDKGTLFPDLYKPFLGKRCDDK